MSQKPGTSRHRAKLSKEGSAFLTNYARTVNSYPNKTEKEAILVTLHSIPGNDEFTLPKLASWFARHRNPSGDTRASVLLDDETILFPKLTPTHLQQLRVLYKKRADPSDGIITFWAGRIGVDKAEVEAWIQYQQEKAKEDDVCTTPESPDIPLQQLASDSASVSPIVSEFPRPHLPTPAKSLSPSISPQTRMPSLPPIAVKVEEARQCLSPASSSCSPLSSFRPGSVDYMRACESRHPLDDLPPLSRHGQVKPHPVGTFVPSATLRVGGQPHSRESTATLTASLRDSLRSNATPSDRSPRTVNEFASKFERVENMIEAFMKKYDSGQLARLGWD